MKEFNIQKLEDVEEFFSYLITKEKINFHPDLDFKDYNIATDEGLRCRFTIKEIRLLDHYMDRCFRVCAIRSEDIYSVVLRIFNKHVDFKKLL